MYCLERITECLHLKNSVALFLYYIANNLAWDSWIFLLPESFNVYTALFNCINKKANSTTGSDTYNPRTHNYRVTHISDHFLQYGLYRTRKQFCGVFIEVRNCRPISCTYVGCWSWLLSRGEKTWPCIEHKSIRRRSTWGYPVRSGSDM